MAKEVVGLPTIPIEVRMPRFLEFVANTDDPRDSSIIVVDKRDERIVSPFQTWLVSEIMSNAASSINVLTERDQVMPPSGGFHLSLFANCTLDGIKAVLAIAVESDSGHTCGQWDGFTADALSHPAFSPFSWPMIREESASYVDIKVYNGNEILFHWILRGYRSDTDLTVQQQFVDEFLVREVREGNPRLSVVVAVFIGYRVSILSYMNVVEGLTRSDHVVEWLLVIRLVRDSSSGSLLETLRTPMAMMPIGSSSGTGMRTTAWTSSARGHRCRALGSQCHISQVQL